LKRTEASPYNLGRAGADGNRGRSVSCTRPLHWTLVVDIVDAHSHPAEPLVLVVEDYADAREMYVEYLRYAGFAVAEAQNGLEAVERAVALRPALVLMDLALPGMDGWEATRRLKADERTRHIPVVAITGHALAGHADAARDAGCDGFLTKPCLPDALVEEIRRRIRG
jgi:two-component system cell cycle response regulator DivK